MAPAPNPLMVRPCFQQDIEMIQLIYASHVTTGTGSFELEPPSLEEMTARWANVVENGWPFLVACPVNDLSRVLGYAYGVQFRARPAYAKTYESSVYVAPSSARKGVGLLLMAELMSMMRNDGVREVLAFIGDSTNYSSINLHLKAGFRHAGTLQKVGEKFGRLLDVVIMQRTLVAPENAVS